MDEKELSRGIEEQEAKLGGCAVMFFVRLLEAGTVATAAWVLTHLSPDANNGQTILNTLGAVSLVIAGGESLIHHDREDVADAFERN